MSLFPLVYFLYILIPLGPLIYVFIKWWSNRESKPVDPNLGIKVITQYFKTLGYHIFLIGLSLIIMELLKGDFNGSGRTGVGIMICGGLVYLVHLLILRRFFNDSDFTVTKRVYNAFNLIFVGLVGITSMVVFLVTILGKTPKEFEAPLAFLIVYLIAWIFQSWFFYKPLFKTKMDDDS